MDKMFVPDVSVIRRRGILPLFGGTLKFVKFSPQGGIGCEGDTAEEGESGEHGDRGCPDNNRQGAEEEVKLLSAQF